MTKVRPCPGTAFFGLVLLAGSLLSFCGVVAQVPSPTARAQLAYLRSIRDLQEGALASIPAPRVQGAPLPPLVVLLHGAGQSPEQMISRFAETPGCEDAIFLAPKSIGQSWDIAWLAQRQALEGATLAGNILRYSSSKDADRVMAAMARLAQTSKTDPARQILLGFSDGASFALGLGTSRDRPFTSVVALSPGLLAIATRPARGRPVLVMHGTHDHVLPFDFTRTTIIPALRSARLAVRFVPFEGDHEISGHPLSTTEACGLFVIPSR